MLMRQKLIFFSFSLLATVAFYSAQAQQADTSNTHRPPVLLTEDKVFEKVEIDASVNAKAWRKHLEDNLLVYLENAVVKGIKAGTYTVNVRFLVEKNGSISNVGALNDPGYGLAMGAVRVVRTGPIWDAGQVNGQKVRSYHTQPITFTIQEK
jgi:protein TonB